MKIKAVIFDMDGLMVESERDWFETAVELANERYSNFAISKDVILGCVGMRRVEMYDYLNDVVGNGFDAKQFNKECMELVYEKAKKYGLEKKKGLDELLKFLKQQNIKMVIASSSRTKTIEDKFVFADLDKNYFDYVITGDMVTEAKPNPEVYLKSVEVLGVDPEDCLVLEDSELGAVAGVLAGLKVCLIPDMKMPSDKTMKKVYARLDSLYDVVDLIKKINA